MKNKMVGLILSLLVMVSPSLIAQRGAHAKHKHNPEARIEKKIKKMTRELDLSNSQQEDIKDILIKSHEQMKGLEQKYPELKSAKEEMRKLQDYKKIQTKAILTSEQMELLKQKRTNIAPESKMGDKKKNPNERIEQMKSELILSEDQVDRLKELHVEVKDKKQAILKEYPQMKEAKKEMKELKTDTNKKIESVLSEEQNEKYRALKKSHHKSRGKKK